MKQDTISFEQAQKELEAVLAEMSDQAVSLADSVALYAKAADLISVCYQQLDSAQVQVEEIDAKLLALEVEHDL